MAWANRSLLTLVGHQIELGAGKGLEGCGPFRAGEVVADTEGVAGQFVDGGEGFALIRAGGAGDAHALGRLGQVQRVGTPVRFGPDHGLVLPRRQLEADALQEGVRQRVGG